jgi:hypothetical protein
MSDANPYRTVILVGIAIGPIAALIAVVALIFSLVGGGGGGATRGGEVNQTVSILDAQAQGLTQRVEALEKRITELSSAGNIDESSVRDLITRQVRDFHVRAGGKLMLPVAETPQKVLDSCLKLLPGGKLTKVEQHSKDGRIYFRVDCDLGGDAAKLRIWENGEIFAASIPPKVAPAALLESTRKMFADIELGKVEMGTNDDGVQTWSLEGEVDGNECNLRATADGVILEAGMDPELAPADVLKAARKAIPGLKTREVWMEREDDVNYWWVSGRRGKDKYAVTTLADGTLVEIEMPIHRVPSKIRAVVAKAFPKLTLDRTATRETEDGESFFVLKGTLDGKDHTLTIGLDGELLEGGDGDRGAPITVPKNKIKPGPDGDIETF